MHCILMCAPIPIAKREWKFFELFTLSLNVTNSRIFMVICVCGNRKTRTTEFSCHSFCIVTAVSTLFSVSIVQYRNDRSHHRYRQCRSYVEIGLVFVRTAKLTERKTSASLNYVYIIHFRLDTILICVVVLLSIRACQSGNIFEIKKFYDEFCASTTKQIRCRFIPFPDSTHTCDIKPYCDLASGDSQYHIKNAWGP